MNQVAEAQQPIKQTVDISTKDNQIFTAHIWRQQQPKATIHIVHGMAEHCQRYAPLAEFLHAQGFQVFTHNHRGHGERAPQGHYADNDGWELVIDDMLQAQNTLCGNEPVILFGHSMGSFISQGFAIRYGEKLSGLILSGSNYQNPALYHAGQIVAKGLKVFQGGRTQSNVMDKVSFASFNNQFKPARTDFDWLSRNKQQVDKYVNDAACGHTCSLQLWIDLFDGLIEISNKNNLAKIPQSLPIYLFAGDQDPVGQKGKGVIALEQVLLQTGHKTVSCKLYVNGRHEMLNEINADEVYQDILNWIQTI